MRVYIPLTLPGLRAAVAAGQLEPLRGTAFGVTDSLIAEYPAADDEELEYLAMSDAARASLRLIAYEDAAALRVVVAADVDAAEPDPAGDRAAVKLADPVPWRQVAAVHTDGADAAEAVRAAAAVVDAADLGDDDAEFTLGTAEDFELAWYAPQEAVYLLAELDPEPPA